MFDRVVVGIIFLALGAITTLIVSWSLTITAEVKHYDTAGLDGLIVAARQVWCEQDNTIWWVEFSKDRGALKLETSPIKINADPSLWLAAVDPDELKSVGLPGWSHLHYGTPTKPNKTTSIITEARGWPMLAMQYSERWDNNKRVISGAIEPKKLWQEAPCEFLPIHPIWFGAFIDSALYGSILFVIALVPYYIRKELRRKTGYCTKCEYDMRHADHKACPECGAPNH